MPLERVEAGSMIRVEGITKDFRIADRKSTRAVESVSFEVRKSGFVSLIGPTGCGKTTILEIIAGLTEPTSGSVIKNNSRPSMAMVFQDYAVFPWMNALRNITYVLSLKGVPKSDRIHLAMEALSKVGLEDFKEYFPSQLSGGMRQRLAIARAVSARPQLLLLDEPFASVDGLTREKLQDLILDIFLTTGTTILLVTHDIDEALYLSDKVVVFSESPGKVVHELEIHLDRPRQRHCTSLNDYKKELTGYMQNDGVEHALRAHSSKLCCEVLQ
jgi:NitT/TauT family transport system ATP-binding protein